MKRRKRAITIFLCLCVELCTASSGGNVGILPFAAHAQHIGIGTYAGGRVISDFSTWHGGPETNSVTMLEWRDGPVFMQNLEPGDKVIVFSSAWQWNPVPSNTVYRGVPTSAWEWREKLVLAGTSSLPNPELSPWNGVRWVNAGTNGTEVLNYVSNVVHSLCVSPDLIEYSRALAPAIGVEADSPLFMFKGEALLEMSLLEWGESESFLAQVLNYTLYQRKIRGLALSYLKDRFGWPATNTVPEL